MRPNDVQVRIGEHSYRLNANGFFQSSPDLLAQLAATEAPLPRALDARAAQAMDLPAVNYDEIQFRFALNEDAMATEKLAEGIRAFCADALKLEQLLLAA